MPNSELERIDDQGMAAWDKHDADGFASLFADQFELHDWTLPEPIRDKDGVKSYLNAWMTAFPDMRVRQARRVVGDDAVAGEIEFTGTNTGPMAMAGNEMPATNKPVMGRGSYYARVQGGKIVEFRAHPDVAGMMMQLGMMPHAG
jgi:predicted ester cyclase